jgi:tetratricopeptide (TPR) repeat protein
MAQDLELPEGISGFASWLLWMIATRATALVDKVYELGRANATHDYGWVDGHGVPTPSLVAWLLLAAEWGLPPDALPQDDPVLAKRQHTRRSQVSRALSGEPHAFRASWLRQLAVMCDFSDADLEFLLANRTDFWREPEEREEERARLRDAIAATFRSAPRPGQRPAAGANGPTIVGEVPQQPPAYQPRADLMAELAGPRPTARSAAVGVLTGPHGAGKTQLAAAYARTRLAARWRVVAWINAADLGGILAGLAEVAAALGIGAGLDAQAAGRAVRHWLEADGRDCVLVFDNVIDPEIIQSYLPAAGAARVIITTNHQPVAALGAGMSVDVFTEPEALALLYERTGLTDARGARALAEELGFLPLALAQAAAVIVTQHLDYPTYLGRLRDTPAGELLPPVPGGQYPLGAAAAIALSLQLAADSDGTGTCKAVMDLLAVLSPGGVPRALLHAAAALGLLGGAPGERRPAEMADRALGQLAGASLLSFTVDGSGIVAHRLVLRVVREQLASGGLLSAICHAAASLLGEQPEALRAHWYDNHAAARDLIAQIVALHEAGGSCADDGLDRSMLAVRFHAVWFLNELGDSATQAITVAESLLADQERIMGADAPETLRTANSLAFAYQDAGRLSDAGALHERTLASREQSLGSDHPQTLISRNNLAAVHVEAGRLNEAIDMFERTLFSREQTLGPGHPDTLASRNNLATVYQSAGRLSEAIALHERNLADRQETLGTSHPHTLITCANLANAYLNAGRVSEAIALHGRALVGMEQALGTDHRDTLQVRDDLAAAYLKAGQAGKAIPLYESNLASRERTLGSNHPHTQASRSNLASAHQVAGHPSGQIAGDPGT